MSTGYIKLFRALKQSAFYKDSEYVHLWVHLLMSVNRMEKRLKIDKSDKYIDLYPGQVLTSRDKLSEQTGISSSKVQRILKAFESEQQIEQQTFSKYRVISISNWKQYQCSEQQDEQQMNSKRTASEQQVNTNKKEEKEEKEEKTPTTAGCTKTELAFIAVFQEKEARLRELFPHANYEAEKETCIAHYRAKPPPLDPYDPITKWFQRVPKTPKATPKKGRSHDFEERFLAGD